MNIDKALYKTGGNLHLSQPLKFVTIATTMMKAALWILAVCMIGWVMCNEDEADKETPEKPEASSEKPKESGSSGSDGGGFSGIPVVGGFWTDYGPDKWKQEAQNWMDKAPGWLQFGGKNK